LQSFDVAHEDLAILVILVEPEHQKPRDRIDRQGMGWCFRGYVPDDL
jgi:hypothetical protein